MKKTIRLLTLLLVGGLLISCETNVTAKPENDTENQASIGVHQAEITSSPGDCVTDVTTEMAGEIVAELIRLANHANAIAAGSWQVQNYPGIPGRETPVMQTTEEIKAYFHSIFTDETAEKYSLPLLEGISVQGEKTPLYRDGENGLVTEKGALTDPPLMGIWQSESVEVQSVTKDEIRAMATFQYAWDRDVAHTGEIRAVYENGAWKLDDSYGITWIGQTTYTTPSGERTDEVVEELWDRLDIAEAFLTKSFYVGTDLPYMDFFTVTGRETGTVTTLNRDVLLAVRPEFTEILTAENPHKAIKEHMKDCFATEPAKKFHVNGLYSYLAEKDVLYVREGEMIGFMGNIRDRYRVVFQSEAYMVLLTYDIDLDDTVCWRYVWLVKQDGTWKVTESIMINPVLHNPDMVELREAYPFQLTERQMKTAVLTSSARLSEAFTFTYENGNDWDTWSLMEMDSRTLPKGEIVRILAEEGNLTRVAILGHDAPCTNGYVKTELLSTDPADIATGNQAVVAKGTVYTAIDGELLPEEYGYVKILSYEGEWSAVAFYHLVSSPTPQTFWVRTADLTYDFDGIGIDIVTPASPVMEGTS